MDVESEIDFAENKVSEINKFEKASRLFENVNHNVPLMDYLTQFFADIEHFDFIDIDQQ